MLQLYRAALQIRRDVPGLGDGPFTWLPAAPGVLAFARDEGFVSVTNLGDSPVRLPDHELVLLASDDVADGSLPPDATAWLRTAPADPDAHPRR